MCAWFVRARVVLVVGVVIDGGGTRGGVARRRTQLLQHYAMGVCSLLQLLLLMGIQISWSLICMRNNTTGERPFYYWLSS